MLLTLSGNVLLSAPAGLASHGQWRPRLLACLDWFLPPAPAALLPSELRRLRVLVGIYLVPLCVTIPLVPLSGLAGAARDMVVGIAACDVIGLLALGWIRLRPRSAGPAILFVVMLNVLLLFLALHRDGELEILKPWSFVVLAASFYLAGARLGMAIGLLTAVEGVLVHLCHLHGLVLAPNMMAPGTFLLQHLIWGEAALAVALLFGWLTHVAYQEAHRAVSQSLESTAASEANLASVLESTSDHIASIDAEQLLVIANQAFLREYRSALGVELRPGDPLFPEGEARSIWGPLVQRALGGERVCVELVRPVAGELLPLELTVNPTAGPRRGCTIFVRDISARKQSEQKVREAHQQMLQLARQAGIAEIATGVLHNVGNTLNSVNVSARRIQDLLRDSRLAGLSKLSALLAAPQAGLATLLASDPRGQHVPGYLAAVSQQLEGEQRALAAEVASLTKNVDHIRALVGLQLGQAKLAGPTEQVSLTELIDDALRLHADSLQRQEIELSRSCDAGWAAEIERHRVLQILVNLISNASHALLELDRPDKRIEIGVVAGEGRFQLQVSDNGVGIAKESLARIFTQGFTTRKDGHGFGLHMCLLTAQAMGGNLTCRSDGVGQGATFALELPRPLIAHSPPAAPAAPAA